MFDIYQSSNAPIVLTFPSTMESIIDISASLMYDGAEIKHWAKSDVTIDGTDITLPLTQEETKVYSAGRVVLKVKYADENGEVQFAEPQPGRIVPWEDLTILEEE